MGHKALQRRGLAVPRLHDGNRGTESRPTAAQRGYGTKWQRERAAYLAAHPKCVACEREGVITEATDVDHFTPVQGAHDPNFWQRSNWQPLCGIHHRRKTVIDTREGKTRR